MTRHPLFSLPLVLLLAVLAACGPGAEAMPRLGDPAEILEETIRTTAELEFVHAKLDAKFTGAATVLGGSNVTIEGDFDLVQREFHAGMTGDGTGGGPLRGELLLLGTDMFARTQGGELGGPADGRWQRSPIDAGSDPRAGIPPTPAIAVALKALLDDPGLSLTFEGIESCGDGQCYHVQATVAPELTWRAVNGGLLGAQPDEEIGPPDPAIPVLVFDVMVHEASRRLVSVKTSITLDGASIDVAATLSNHDVEFDLLPPPPDQVVDSNIGGEAPGAAPGVIVDDVGEGVEGAP